MSEALYQAEIVTRAKAGQQDTRLDPYDRRVTVDNPLCGDRVTLDLKVTGDRIDALGHRTRGCALCQAAAETLRRCIPGHDLTEAQAARSRIAAFLATGESLPAAWQAFDVFEPVRAYPSRQSCVLLPLDALVAATSDGAEEQR